MKPLAVAFIAFGILLTVFGLFLTDPSHVGYVAIQENPSMGTALAGSGVSIMIIAALSENWKERHEKEIRNVAELLIELYGAFDSFNVIYSDKMMGNTIGARISSHEELEKAVRKYGGYGEYWKPNLDLIEKRVEMEYGVKPHPYKTTIVMPTDETLRQNLRKKYEYLNEIAGEGSTDRARYVYKDIQLTTEHLKNPYLMHAFVIAHEMGHDISFKKNLILETLPLYPIAEGIATGIGFVYLLNKAKKGSLKKEAVLDFIEGWIRHYTLFPKDYPAFSQEDHPQTLGLRVLGDFDPRADKSLDDMMGYLLERVNLAMDNPLNTLDKITLKK